MLIPKDTMTPKERMTAYAEGKPIDRFPALPMMTENASVYCGHTNKEYSFSPDVIVRTMENFYRSFGPDGVSVDPSLQALPEALGATLHFPEYSAPVVVEPGFTDYAQIDDMEPADPYRSGRLGLYLEAIDRLKERIGDEVLVDYGIGGPFTAAMLLRGTEQFLRDIIKKPEQVHKVMELTTQSLINIVDVVCGKMGYSISFCEPLSSTTVISRDVFLTFSKPYMERIARHMTEKYNMPPPVHICGKSKALWNDLADAGFSAFSIDNIEDLAEARDIIGDRMTIIGNVAPVEVLLNGDRQTVYEAARICIEKGRTSKNGFVLGSGCDIPGSTPGDNIKALVDAARIYGRWDN